MKYVIGIDPDNIKSGGCLILSSSDKIECVHLSFPKLIDWILNVKEMTGNNLVVVVEAGWLNKSNWHTKRGDNTSVAAMKGKGVGMNEQTSKLIIEMLEHNGIEVITKSPLRKCWKGADGKITHEEIEKIFRNVGIEIPKRTNQEVRDAMLLAFDHWGFSMRIKSKLI